MSRSEPATLRVERDLKAEFHEPVTGSIARPRRTLKHDDTFVVLDAHGDIGASAGGADGLFHRDTRFLSRLELRINGEAPLLLGSNITADNLRLTADLTNPDLMLNGSVHLAKDTVHALRSAFVWRSGFYQRLRLQNYGQQTLSILLTLSFDSDFADVFEVRGMRRGKRGIEHKEVLGANSMVLLYEGLDQRSRKVCLSFDPAPTTLTTSKASFSWVLAPSERRSVYVLAQCDDVPQAISKQFFGGMRAARRELKGNSIGNIRIRASHSEFNEMLRRSAADLHMLTTKTADGPYPYAGIPWYSTTFGRDGLITALQTLWCAPHIAKGVLKRLAAHQALVNDPSKDAEPGKIVHEMRCGEMAALKEIPFGLYYGSIDATPLFVVLAGCYLKRTGDLSTISELWENVERALHWIDGEADVDGDGFIEYQRATNNGLLNQGWKDSDDAIFHADGSLAEGPIALAEVQGYVYAAKRAAAHCARVLGDDDRAGQLEGEAKRLQQRFQDAFWCAELGTYALALDGNKKQCRVRSSNAGQTLLTGIASAEHAATIAQQLLCPSFFSGWGIRTVASEECRFNPMSYHNGSVWPHDNAMIAMGLSRYGFSSAVKVIFAGLVEAASHMEWHRLPELFCGFQKRHGRGPTLYPVACSPQAWAAAVPFALLQSMLRFEFDVQARRIRLNRPQLPAFLRSVQINGLSVDEGSVDLQIARQGDSVSVDVVRANGEVTVSVS
jgi:glycogen debranching enzyme